jgi:hypothetical protein
LLLFSHRLRDRDHLLAELLQFVRGHQLETFTGCCGAMCAMAWLLQRQYRLSHGKGGTEIVTDPDLHKAMLLMRAACIPCDRLHPDDDWEFPEYMKEPVP